MNKKEFYFSSHNGVNEIHCVWWEPKEVKAVLQISHGMTEHIERYEEFAGFLTERGFLVVGNDHMGHGTSVSCPEEWGYFAKEGASEKLVEDLHKLTLLVKEQYPEVPYFLLGHSMGSFIARRYLMTYASLLTGALIVGTGNQPRISVYIGLMAAKMVRALKGEDYRSTWLRQRAFGAYTKRIPNVKHGYEWLSKNEENIGVYMKNPACTFSFTVNGYETLFTTVAYILKKENIQKIPKKLPIVFLSGTEDPVGGYGNGVNRAYRAYKKAGIEDVKIKLYPDDRHEILNEMDREEVYQDIYTWICRHI